jgi:hypothetical protein
LGGLKIATFPLISGWVVMIVTIESLSYDDFVDPNLKKMQYLIQSVFEKCLENIDMKIRSYEKKFDSFFHVILRNLVLIVVI